MRLSLYLVLSCLGTHDLFLDMGGVFENPILIPHDMQLLLPVFSFSVAVILHVLSSSRFNPLNPLTE